MNVELEWSKFHWHSAKRVELVAVKNTFMRVGTWKTKWTPAHYSSPLAPHAHQLLEIPRTQSHQTNWETCTKELGSNVHTFPQQWWTMHVNSMKQNEMHMCLAFLVSQCEPSWPYQYLDTFGKEYWAHLCEGEAQERRSFSAGAVSGAAGSCCRPAAARVPAARRAPRWAVAETAATPTRPTRVRAAVAVRMEWVHADYDLRATPAVTVRLQEKT